MRHLYDQSIKRLIELGDVITDGNMDEQILNEYNMLKDTIEEITKR